MKLLVPEVIRWMCDGCSLSCGSDVGAPDIPPSGWWTVCIECKSPIASTEFHLCHSCGKGHIKELRKYRP